MRFYPKLMQLIVFGGLLCLDGLLVGCADAPPTPTPIDLAPTCTRPIGADAPATSAIAVPTSRQVPTSTRTPWPTHTPTPTQTPLPAATATSTPEPSAQLDAARRHQMNGDYERAAAACQAVLANNPTASQDRQARYLLAENYYLNRDYSAAAAAWEEFMARYPDDSRLPSAMLMAARSYHATNDCDRATLYYQSYLTQTTVLADMVYEWRGDCQAARQRWTEAIDSYRRGLTASQDQSAQVSLREKIASGYLALSDPDAAVREYDAILAVARIDAYRAQIEYQAGQALAGAGQTEAAYARYRRVVDSYPSTLYAYLSLVELVNAGVEVDEFQRGLVDYYAGATYPEAYEAAIRAFDRYLTAQPAPKANEALFRKALAQRALDRPQAALQTFETLLSRYPTGSRSAQTWWEKAATLAAMGEDKAAVKTYQDLAAFFPADALAPKALWQAARLLETTGKYTEAARLYQELQTTFPAFENADEALWRAGLAHYREGDREKAAANWQALLDKYPKSEYRAKSLYWLGKVTTKGDYWDQLVAAYPHHYYALRVKQIQTGASFTASRFITTAIEAPPWDTAQASAEIEDWLRTWTQGPADMDLLTLPVTITQRPDFQRGQALLSIGLRREALESLDQVRAAFWQEPAPLAQLALFFREQGLYGLAARAASRLVDLWTRGTIHTAPPAVQRLAYPLVYTDLLSAEAQAHGLDPLLLAALIRQESLFEPAAESYAGARGLGQVMPATGEGIARSLGLDEFELDDLYRPFISIKFGAYYLAVQMKRFDQRLLAALAAYNGGPGNTIRWLEAADNDLDLFVEVITANQSRIYLQRVYEQYLFYERLYRP